MGDVVKFVLLVTTLLVVVACDEDCKYEGKTYTEGEIFPDKDGCNTCQCKSSGPKEYCPLLLS